MTSKSQESIYSLINNILLTHSYWETIDASIIKSTLNKLIKKIEPKYSLNNDEINTISELIKFSLEIYKINKSYYQNHEHLDIKRKDTIKACQLIKNEINKLKDLLSFFEGLIYDSNHKAFKRYLLSQH